MNPFAFFMNFPRILSRETAAIFICLFCMPAFVICMILFDAPWKTVLLQRDASTCAFQNVEEQKVVDDSPYKTFFSKSFQTSLGLDWYDVCILNKNKIFVGKQRMSHIQYPELGALSLVISVFGNGDATTTVQLYAQPDEKAHCQSFRYSGSGRMVVVPGPMTVTQPVINFPICYLSSIDETNTEIFYRPNIVAYLFKYLTVFSIWSASVVGFIQLWKISSEISKSK